MRQPPWKLELDEIWAVPRWVLGLGREKGGRVSGWDCIERAVASHERP